MRYLVSLVITIILGGALYLVVHDLTGSETVAGTVAGITGLIGGIAAAKEQSHGESV